MSDVIERIEKGKSVLYVSKLSNHAPAYVLDLEGRAELLRLAKIGQTAGETINGLMQTIESQKETNLAILGKMQWVEGVPPEFGKEERKWIIFEHLTPFTRTTVYDTAVWQGKYYSNEKVKVTVRWSLLPIPAMPKGDE